MTESSLTRTLTVRGQARTSTPAGAAIVVLAVEAVRPTAGGARDTAAATMARVIAAIRAAGAGERDVRTAGLSLEAELEYRPDGGQRRVGFRMTNRLEIRLADPGLVAAVIDAAIEAGASTLEAVGFEADATASPRAAALEAAFADARAAAEVLARAAGTTLGDVRAVRETTGGIPVPLAAATLETARMDTPVLPGTVVEALLEVTWDLRTD